MKRLHLLLILLLLPAQALHAQQPSVRVEIVAPVLIRATPGGAILGSLQRGARVDVSGISEDRQWLYFLYWGKPAWVTASPRFVRALGDLSLLGKRGVIDLIQYSITPDIPEPGQPFTIHLTLESPQEIGAFKVATTCSDFAMLVIPRLAAGVAQQIDLRCPGDSATGPHKAQLIIDVDQQVSGGQKTAITYFVDRLYDQIQMIWPAYSDLNVDGLSYDLAYDGMYIRALHNAKLFAIDLESLALLHYDRLVLGEITDKMLPSGVIGIVSAEGNRGALQVIASTGDTMQIAFRIYKGDK